MNRSEAKATLRWLNGNPPLQELMDRYPSEWEEAGSKAGGRAGKVEGADHG